MFSIIGGLQPQVPIILNVESTDLLNVKSESDIIVQ